MHNLDAVCRKFLFQNHFKHTEVNEIQNYCGSNRLLFVSRREKLSHIDSSTVNRVFGQTESVITVSFSNELCLMTCGWALNHFHWHQKWNGAHFEWQRIASLFAFKMTKLKMKITKPNQTHTQNTDRDWRSNTNGEWIVNKSPQYSRLCLTRKIRTLYTISARFFVPFAIILIQRFYIAYLNEEVGVMHAYITFFYCKIPHTTRLRLLYGCAI